MALVAALILGGGFFLGCDDSDDDDVTYILYQEVPLDVQTAMEASFGDAVKSPVRIERDNDSYEFWLKDGTKIDFDLNGKWKEIDNDFGIPDKYLAKGDLAKIKDYAATNYPGKKIAEIDKKAGGFEIDILNGPQDVMISNSNLAN